VDGTTIIGRIEINLETKTYDLGSVIVNEPNVFTSSLCPQVNGCGDFQTYKCMCACGY